MSPPLPDVLPIQPFTRPVRGEVELPGSKSLTNRALLLAALCDRPVRLTGALFSEDTHLMGEALKALGFTIAADSAAHTLDVSGQGNAFNRETPVALHVGLAGTAARFLTALCAAAPRGVYHIDGIPQMRKRPMRGLIDALRSLGADIRCTGEDGFFPVEIHARGLRGGPVAIDARESSQMLSALLMVAPLAAEPIEITTIGGVRWPFVQMTALIMQAFQPGNASAVERLDEQRFRVTRTPYSAQGTYAIEPDATAASYFAALPLVTGGSLTLRNLHPGLQGDTQFIEVLQRVGLTATRTPRGLDVSFTLGSPRHGAAQNFNEFSDTFLTLAAIAPLLLGETRITGVVHSRKQETDRVAGMVSELRKLGQDVHEHEDGDGLTITPRPLKTGVEIETYGDHRFAMSFGILGCHDLHGDGRPWLSIKDPACCAKTFPHFFQLLESLRLMSNFLIVAVDGGAASGKSSTSRAVSERFNLLHVDTGSYYRAITAQLLRLGHGTGDTAAIAAALPSLALGTRIDGRSARMEIDGRVIPEAEIRGAEVTAAVSHFAAIPEVRGALLAYQRDQAGVARAHGFRGLIMEGRDIGSVIFPDADLRFFLHADVEARAKRRELEGRPDAVAERDRLDATRKTAPLTLPAGATAIDSTYLNLQQVVDKISDFVAAKLA